MRGIKTDKGLPVSKAQYIQLSASVSVHKRKKREGGRRKHKGWSWSRRETWTAVNFDSWPTSSGNSILMVVLRAEREEGWLILGYVTPPTLNCLAHAARLEMSQQSQRGKVCGFTCVKVLHACLKVWERCTQQKLYIYVLVLYRSRDQLQHTVIQLCICHDHTRTNKRGFLVRMSFAPLKFLNP